MAKKSICCISERVAERHLRKLRLFTERCEIVREASNLTEGIELCFVFTYIRHGIVKDLREGFVELHCNHIEASTVKK